MTIQTLSPLQEKINRLKAPLEIPVKLVDNTLKHIIDLILKLSLTKRLELIEIISRSLPPGYMRVTFIPPTPELPETTMDSVDDEAWLAQEMEQFLAYRAEHQEMERELTDQLLNKYDHVAL